MEDAAQSFGAKQEGRLAGSIGDVGIFSFGMAKNVMAFFGGMMLTHDRKVFEYASKHLATFPVESRSKLLNKAIGCFIKDVATTNLLFPHLLFPVFRHGYRNNIKSITRYIETELDLSLKNEFPDTYKTQMSPLQAGIILAKLGKVDQHFQHRLECARIYNQGLSDIPELTIPPFTEDGSHVYNYYTICFEKREELRLYLMNNRRDAALQHIKNTADLPSFKEFYRDCPKARKWASEAIMLPNYIRYSLKEVAQNVEVLRRYFGK
jgi:perosamine synthetase